MKTHTVDIRVRYAETDQMGAVYYANYLLYFETGRTEYLRGLGTSYRSLEEGGVYFPVVEVNCRYLGGAHYDDELQIITWVDRLRPTRIDFRHLVVRKGDGARLASGHVVLACLDSGGRPIRIPEPVTKNIELCSGPEGAPATRPLNQ